MKDYQFGKEKSTRIMYISTVAPESKMKKTTSEGVFDDF